MKIQGIYAIKNKINGKYYVGQACKNTGIKGRFVTHKNDLRKHKHYNSYLQNAWNKYGEDNFELILLENVCDVALLDEREQYWIDMMWGHCYNLQPTAGGSNRGRKHSEETKRKIGEANRRRIWTTESRKKQSESQKLRVKLHTEEEKRKISLANKGKKCPHNIIRNKLGLSFEARRKISEARKGKKLSAEHRKKISDGLRASDSHRGKKLSAEHRKKISDGVKRWADSLKNVLNSVC